MASRKSTRKSTRTSARRKPAKKATKRKAAEKKPAKKKTAKKTTKKKATKKKAAKKKTAKKATRKKTVKKAAKKKTVKKAAKKKTVKKAAKKKTAKKKTAKKKTARRAPPKKKTAKKAPARRAPAKKKAAKKAPARRAPAKKKAVKKAPAAPVAESSLVKLTLDLQSERPSTVSRSINRLQGVVGPGEIIEFIETLGRLEDEQPLQVSVIEVCEGIEVPDADDRGVTALLSALHFKLERQPATVIAGSLTVLGRIGHRDSLYPIIRVLQDKYRRTSLSAWETEKHVRITAARALGRIGHRDAAVYLIEALNDHVGDVVIEVCAALKVVGDARCIPNLQDILRKAARQELKDALVDAIDHMRQVGYRRD